MTKIAVVVGSLRKESFNLKLARALEKLSAGKLEFSFVKIGDLPLFNQDLESNVPAPVITLKQEIESADGVLFVTPEYNRSIPGVLKNAIDWASRPYGKSSWAGKPAAICGTSPGAVGAAVAQNHLRSICAGFLDMKLMGQPEVYFSFKEGIIDETSNVTDEKTKVFLQGFVDKFAVWVDSNGQAQKRAA